jgi:two-component SAPR family response regulator
MPDQAAIEVEDGTIRLTGDIAATSESAHFEEYLAEAARLHDADRLAATASALEIYDRGDYLPALDSPWVAERRALLDDLAANARHEAAELEFAAGRYQDAGRLAESVLDAHPLRESTWRLSMRVAAMLGDTDKVLSTFEACRLRLAEIGTGPSAETRQLVDRLRR